MSIYPNHTFPPSTHVNKRISGLCQVESRLVVSRAFQTAIRRILFAGGKFIIHGNAVYFPVLESNSLFVRLDKLHLLSDAFPVVNGASKVDPSHGFNPYIQLCAFRQLRQNHLIVVLPAVQITEQFAISIYLCPVVCFGNAEKRIGFCSRQRGTVENASPSLVEVFHRLHLFALNKIGQLLKKGSCRIQFHGGYFDDGERFGNGTLLLLRTAVFAKKLLQKVILGSGPPGFANGSIIIV